MTRYAILLGALLLSACSASPEKAQSAGVARPLDGFSRFTSQEGGYSVEMPAKIAERNVREGRMMASIVHAVDIDETRYEVARFDMPEPLDDASRADLLAKVERGLSQRPGARSKERRSVVVGGVAAMELILALPDGAHGKWWIFFSGKERLFQVSVLGPKGERHERGAEVFFRSFELRSAQ